MLRKKKLTSDENVKKALKDVDERQLMNAIVTGGAGFIGSHLLDRLVNHFGEIYVIDNLVRTNGLRNIQHLIDKYPRVIHFINADVSTFDFDKEFSRKNYITHCFHLAATRINRCAQRPMEGHRFIADGGFNVVDFCGRNNIKLFFASTASVYNRPERLPIQETDPCIPHTIYGAGKFYTENLIRTYSEMYNMDYAINRFFSVYGERMDNEGAYTEVIWNWLSDIRDGKKTITVFGDPKEKILDLVHVDDVIQAILLTSFIPHKGVFNVSSQTGITLQELIKLIQKVTKTKLEVEVLPENRSDIEKARIGDITKLKEIEWKHTVSIEEGIRRTWEWVNEKR